MMLEMSEGVLWAKMHEMLLRGRRAIVWPRPSSCHASMREHDRQISSGDLANGRALFSRLSKPRRKPRQRASSASESRLSLMTLHNTLSLPSLKMTIDEYRCSRC